VKGNCCAWRPQDIQDIWGIIGIFWGQRLWDRLIYFQAAAPARFVCRFAIFSCICYCKKYHYKYFCLSVYAYVYGSRYVTVTVRVTVS